MIKGFIGALISAIVLFAAGGITIAVFGTNERSYTAYVESVEYGAQSSIHDSVEGEKTWQFGTQELRSVRIHSSNVKTYIAPSEDGSLSVTAQTDGWQSIDVDAELDGGMLDLNVSRGGWFGGSVSFGGENGTVVVYLPDTIYDELTLELGSGKLEARGLAARVNVLDVGSGTFEFEQKAGFSSDMLNLHMGSGSVKMTNAAAVEHNISIGSGSFMITGLNGQGLIDIGSGKGEVKFDDVIGYNTFDLSSGSLEVYIPEDTRADIYTDIGSGSITVDCCGVHERISDDRRVSLNGGSDDETLYCDLGSGKIEFRNASDYGEPDMFGDFPVWGEFSTDIATIDGITISDDTLQQAASFSSVTTAF